MPFIEPAIALSTRQEAFCRHYAVSGNAADAARQAGYSGRSARQTGCALLERPYIVERLRRIRLSWKRTERDEVQIVLARLEQAWDAAVVSGSAYMMVRVLRFQAEITGLVAPAGGTRARLWPLAHEDELGEIEAGEAHEAGTEPGPLAEAVRSGRDRAERALARHRESREELETQEGFDAAAHEEAARRLAAAVEERTRLPVSFGTPPEPANDLPPPPALAKAGDDPPEETYEQCPWAPGGGFGGDDSTDNDRADGAEHDWLHQRRYGYDEIYDPWAPEEVEERRRNRLEREQRDGHEDGGWCGPATGTKKKKKRKRKKARQTGPATGNAPRTMTEHDIP
ncbi:MAG: terminase small subunit [Alphaproteobacteria bacterium]|nr:terminase small subunit [Alphaproteobacteria bacterium]